MAAAACKCGCGASVRAPSEAAAQCIHFPAKKTALSKLFAASLPRNASEPVRGAPRAMSAADIQDLLPVIDLSVFLSRPATDPAAQDACRRAAECLRDTGALIVRDPRVSYEDNGRFLDMMEQYFGQSHEAKLTDVRAALSYQVRCEDAPRCTVCCLLRLTGCPRPQNQVGATPELTEVPRCKVRG
jgi:hypothetical protein